MDTNNIALLKAKIEVETKVHKMIWDGMFPALETEDRMSDEQLDQQATDEKESALVSECCGAGTYGDYMICQDCKEHCTGVNEVEE